MKTRVLIVHNVYKHTGGEDVAVQQQRALLEARGHPVYMYTRDNAETDAFNPLQKAVFFLSSFFSRRTYREIRTIVRQFKPDVAHVHNVSPLISPSAYWALKHEGVPIIQTVHNFRFMCANGLFFRDGHPCELCKTGRTWNAVRYRCYRDSRLLSALYAGIIAFHRLIGTWRKIGCFIAISRFTADKLIEGKIANPDRIRVLGNFMPAIPQPSTITPPETPYVMFIGRLSAEKGAEVLVDAAAQVPELDVKIVGDGPQENELKSYAAHLQNVEFVGRVEGERKYQMLRAARALVLPSICYENFGMVLLEALHVGTPVLASQLGGLPYILQDGVDSLFFAPGDPNSLAERLRQALHQPELMQRLGHHGQQFTVPKYAEEVHYRQLTEIQAEVLANCSAAQPTHAAN